MLSVALSRPANAPHSVDPAPQTSRFEGREYVVFTGPDWIDRALEEQAARLVRRALSAS